MTNTQNLYNICQELMATNSTLEKQAILKREENNEPFKELLKFLLDNLVVTGISKKKIDKIKISIDPTSDAPYNTDTEITYLLNYFKEHNTGRDEDIMQCQLFLYYVDDEYKDFIKSIITKSLKLGIDAKTANKVYGKTFIPKLDVQLGTSIEHCKIKEGTWFSVSQKLNGSRCFYYKGKLYTRQGKVYTGCQHIIEDIKKLESEFKTDEEYVYDGELVLKDNSLSDSERFQKGVGIANSDKESKEELKLIIFDTLPTSEFEKGTSNDTYRTRKTDLFAYRIGIGNLNLQNVETVPMFYSGTDQNKIWEWLEYAEQNDMEGVMVNLDTPYVCKRTKNLIKVKKFYTMDLPIIRIEEGDSKLKGTLGAIVCDYKGNEVKCGTGFSDDLRKTFWNMQDKLIGRVAEIKYKEVTKNKDTQLESLQFPVFVTLREDGKEVSYE